MRNSVSEEEPDELVSYQDSRQTQFPAADESNDEILVDPFAALDDLPFLQLLARATSGAVPLMDVATVSFRHHSDAEEDRSESWSAKFMPAADLEEPRGSIQWPCSSGTLMTQGAIHYPMMWDNGLNTSYGAVAEYNFNSRDSLVDPSTLQLDRKEEAKHVGEDLHSTEDGSRTHNINNKIVKDGDPQNDKECTEAGFSFITGVEFKEIKSPEQGSNEEPNLKTPQQRPRKRKHRPKVVQQGESKRTPKQATPNPKNPTPKKKYVKRKGINDQASDDKQTSRENDDRDQHHQTKRCSRRALNFELEDHSGERIEDSCRLDLSLDLNNHVHKIRSSKPYLNMNSVWHEQRDQSHSFQQTKQMSTTTNLPSGELNGNQQSCFQMKSGADGSQETVYKSSTSGKSKKMPKLATPKTKSSSLKRKYVRRNVTNGQTSKHEKVTGDGRENSCRAPTLDLDDQQQKNSHKPRLNVNSVLHQYSFSSSKEQSYSVELYREGNTSTYKDSRSGLPNLNEDTDYATLDDQESAKLQEYYYTSDHAHHNIMDLLKAEYNLLQAQAAGVADSSGIISCTSFSESYMEIYSKMRTVMEHNSIASSTPSPGETSRNFVEETREGILFDASFSNLLESFSPNIQSNVEANVSLQETQFTTHHRLHGNILVPLDMQIQNISNGPAQVRDLSSLAVIEKSETPPVSVANPTPVTVGSGQEDDISSSLATYTEALVAKEKARLARRKRAERMKVTRTKSSAPRHVTSDYSLPVDVLTERLKLLDISRQNLITYEECNALIPYGTRYQEQNKLVLYERDGAVVPLDGSLSMLKRRRARPRVDLDEETNNVWNLLLENIDNQGINGTDEEKVKWWEEERSVFQGRASSFIARMRLVQGDRRFSQWKGSVVDSVVGVFLTQNVSDHLSSSAFISLAAHFPLKQSISNQERHEDIAGVLEVETEVCKKSDSEEKREETINNNESWDSSTGSLSSSEVSESNLDDCGNGLSATPGKSFTRLKPRTKSECVTEEKNSPLQDGVSSQGSVVYSEGSPDTSCTHSADRIRPDTETSTDAQDPTNEPSRSFNGSSMSFMGLLEMADNLVYCENQIPRGEFTEPDLNLEDFQIQPESMLVNRQGHDGAFNDSESALGESNIPSSYPWINKTEDIQSGLVTTVIEGESLNNAREEEDGKIRIERQIFRGQIEIAKDTTNASNIRHYLEYQEKESTLGRQNCFSDKPSDQENVATSNDKKRRADKNTDHACDWDNLRKQAQEKSGKRERPSSTRDSLDWEAVRRADVKEIAKVIKARGMNNRLAERIKDFLNRLVRDHRSIDLEWLKDVPPDKAKEYLLSIRGLGLKSTECVRLLTLQHLAFPVDTNVGRIAVRLGWVPLQPLPESLQLHLLELYPVMESIQKYLWPRLCKLDQLTLYELHYQMITFGKVFCTKSKPNCNVCPMRGECRHFASAFASSRLALPGPQEKNMMIATQNREATQNNLVISNPLELPAPSDDHQAQINKQLQTNQPPGAQSGNTNCYPIIEEPKTPEPECTQVLDSDIEDAGWEDPDEIPTIRLNIEEFSQNLQNYMQQSMDLQEGDVSKALVALTSEVASIPTPKLKNMSQLRTEHQVYELPDSHPLLKELDNRELDDPCSYLLAIWTPGETATSIQPPENKCCSQNAGQMCQETTCFACNSVREANSKTVRGTLLIPCRTAMKGSFPLNGTYFQVNEVFADHDSSLNPIDVPRDWIWNLSRRTVHFGTSIPTIFKGLSTEEIQHCFWRGYVCVRGFDRKTRAPRPLMARLHFPASKMSKKKGTNTNNDGQNAAPS